MEYSSEMLPPSAQRVRRASTPEQNHEIDQITGENLRRYTRMESGRVLEHIEDLDREWDVERVLEVNASTLMLTGLALGLTVDRKWFVLSAIVGGFLLQHGVQGWCPPVPLLRRLGFRTRSEIDTEKFALKAHLSTLD